jgi:hypothetical protein
MPFVMFQHNCSAYTNAFSRVVDTKLIGVRLLENVFFSFTVVCISLLSSIL